MGLSAGYWAITLLISVIVAILNIHNPFILGVAITCIFIDVVMFLKSVITE